MSEYTLDWLLGDVLTTVELDQSDRWVLRFASGGAVYVQCPWRIIQDAAIRLSGADHRQQYGLREPIDAATQLVSVLGEDSVVSVHVAENIGDIIMKFESGAELQILPFSSGYEAWESWSAKGFNVIAQGGQQLVGFNP